MARNIILIFALMAALILIWLLASEPLNQTTNDHQIADTSPVELSSSDVPKIKPNSNPDLLVTTAQAEDPRTDTKEQDQEALLEQLNTELGQSKYSEDPVIELTSIIMEISGCEISRTFSRWNYLEPSSEWKQLNQQAEDECQKLKQQYPIISNDKDNDKYLALLKPTTVIGKQLHDAYNQMQSSPDFAIEHINNIYYIGVNSKNAQLLSLAKLFSTAGFNRNEEIFPYHELLQTEDNAYIRLIDQLALESMACSFNNGVTCQPKNYNMLDRCKQVPEVCGLSFNQWFDTYVSMGIKADVKILSDYYQQLQPR